MNLKKVIPLKSVPIKLNPDDPYYQNIYNVRIENENGSQNGLFGWCVICRKEANFYCKDFRVPICSLNCKKIHFEHTGLIIKNYKNIYSYKYRIT